MNTKLGFFVYCILIATVAQSQYADAVESIKKKSNSISLVSVSDSVGNSYTAEITLSTLIVDADKAVYTAVPNKNVYVSKKDVTGKLVWKKQLRGITNYAYSEPSIAQDSYGNIYVTYNRQTLAKVWSSFIVRLDNNGDIIWTKCLGDKDTGGINARSISVSNNNLNVTGFFWGTIECDTSKGVCNLVSENQPGVFACNLDKDGNFMWIRGVEPLESLSSTTGQMSASKFMKVTADSNH